MNNTLLENIKILRESEDQYVHVKVSDCIDLPHIRDHTNGKLVDKTIWPVDFFRDLILDICEKELRANDIEATIKKLQEFFVAETEKSSYNLYVPDWSYYYAWFKEVFDINLFEEVDMFKLFSSQNPSYMKPRLHIRSTFDNRLFNVSVWPKGHVVEVSSKFFIPHQISFSAEGGTIKLSGDWDLRKLSFLNGNYHLPSTATGNLESFALRASSFTFDPVVIDGELVSAFTIDPDLYEAKYLSRLKPIIKK